MSLSDPYRRDMSPAARGPIGVVIAGLPNETQPFMTLTPGNPKGVEVLATTRDAADLLADVQALKPQIVLLSPNARNYSLETLRQLTAWPESPLAVVGLVPTAGAWGAEMAGSGAVAFYHAPVTPATVEQFAREAPEVVERARSAWRAPVVASGLPANLPGAVGAVGYRLGVIPVWSTKGGDGKTTLATEVACLLSQIAGRRVLLVDANMNLGHVALHLGVSPLQNNLLHLASDFRAARGLLTKDMLRQRVVEADSALNSGVKAVESRLHLLLGITNIQHATSPDLIGEQGRKFVAELLRVAREHYEFVIVDLGSSINTGVHLGALTAADMVLFIASVDRASILFNQHVLDLLVSEGSLSRDKFRLVINHYQPEAGIDLKDVARVLQMPLFAVVPRDPSAAVLRCANEGQSFALRHLDIRKNSPEVEAVLRGLLAVCEGLFPPMGAIIAAREEKLSKKKGWFARRPA